MAVSVFAPSVEELEIGSELQRVSYSSLCRDMKAHAPSCLRVLSIHIRDISATEEDAHALTLLFSNAPLLERFKVIGSRFPRQRWDMCLESFVVAFSRESSLICHLDRTTGLT